MTQDEIIAEVEKDPSLIRVYKRLGLSDDTVSKTPITVRVLGDDFDAPEFMPTARWLKRHKRLIRDNANASRYDRMTVMQGLSNAEFAEAMRALETPIKYRDFVEAIANG